MRTDEPSTSPRSGLDRLRAAPPPLDPEKTVQLQVGIREPTLDDLVADPVPTPAWLYGDRTGAPGDCALSPAEPVGEEDTVRYVPPRFARLRATPIGAVAVIVVGLLACAFTALTVLRTDSEPVSVAFGESVGPTSMAGSVSATSIAAQTSSERTSDALVVSVVGRVAHPGLITVKSGARVADAIEAAGGARNGADVFGLNLARRLSDGEQVLVGYSDPNTGQQVFSAVIGAAGEPAVSATGSNSGAPSGAVKPATTVNLNTADAAALDALPGVGPVTAAAIIEWRTRNGRFTSVDQLAEVEGIGPARLSRLRDLVTV